MKTTTAIFIIIILGLTFFFVKHKEVQPYPPTNSQATETTSWLQASSTDATWLYPLDFGKSYVSPVDWPPTFNFITEPFTCTTADTEEGHAGKTEQLTVHGQTYCKTTVNEGAAGSVYRQYTYVTKINGKNARLTFSARLPQCVNYEPAEKTLCAADQASFNPDILIDTIVQTISTR